MLLLCFIDPRVRKIRNEASSCPGIFSKTLRFYYVASFPGSPLPHLLDGHRKLVGSSLSAIPARSCLGPVWYPWESIVEFEVSLDETPGLMTLHPHNTDMYKASHVLNHHSHSTDPIRGGDKKLMLSTRLWLVLPNSITLQGGSLIDASSLLQSLGAPTEFGRSRRVWALLRVKMMKSTL